MKMTGFSIVVCSLLFCIQLHATELNIYGQGHLSIDNVDDGSESSIYATSSSSRLGLNGEHKISETLKIIFQYETGVDLTAQGSNDGNGGADSSGQLFTRGRPSYIGLQGRFGKVLVGHIPFLDQWANDYNLFADQVGDLGNLWEASGIPGRSDNAIYYISPDFSGMNIAVTYIPEEGVDDADYYLLKGSYSSDKLKLGVIYTSIDKSNIYPDEHTGYAITAGYDFGLFSIGGGYQIEQDIGGIPDNDRDSVSIGASMKFGKIGNIKLQLSRSSSDESREDATQFAIGYDCNLDKNTVFYVAYASMDNDDNANFSVNGKGHGDKVVPSTGKDPTALSIGVVYKFDHKFM